MAGKINKKHQKIWKFFKLKFPILATNLKKKIGRIISIKIFAIIFFKW